MDKNLNLINRNATAELVVQLPMNGIHGLAFGGPERNVLFAIAGTAVINVNTLKVEQRTSRQSHIYKIVGVDGTGKQFKRANV